MFRTDQKIGNYHLVRRLGRGGFGEVWLAQHRTKFLTTKVAVKLPLDDQVDHDVIKQEAEIWELACGHPNVLPIIEANEYDGQIVIVSEFAPDGSLEDLLDKTGAPLAVDQAIEMSIGILAGLEFLHNRDIIHRDVKPANILLQGNTPRLADFGISRVIRTNSLTLNAAGTPNYMAPETFDGKRNAQTDIWAVAVMLYQMLAGGLPFRSADVRDLMVAILMRDPIPLPTHIPSPLRDVVAKALTKHPSHRYQTAFQLKEELRTILYSFSSHRGAGPTTRIFEISPLKNSPVSFGGERKTIAILPFKNLNGDAASEFYEFSLADAVTTGLARLRRLTVSPSSVIANYQGKVFDPREAGKEMSVSTVLSASFIHSDTRLRVTAQLLDVLTGEIIWSDQIDSETSDIFALQDKITQHIIHGLEFDLSIAEQERLGIRPTKSNKAYEEYLRGRDKFARFIFRSLSLADFEAAVACFKYSVEIDSKFALAWSGLGACYANKVFKGLGDSEDYVLAEEAFRRALELDPNVTEARVLRGFIYLWKGEKQMARAEAVRLVDQFPNEAPPYFLTAVIHRLDGEYDKALTAWDELERVDPQSSVLALSARARLYSLKGQHERALREVADAEALEPDHPVVKVIHGEILYCKGDTDKAARVLKSVTNENPHMEGIHPLYAVVLAANGQGVQARSYLSGSVLKKASADHDISYWVAAAYALLGEIDQAFDWLRRSVELGFEDRPRIENDFSFSNLRSDHRFADILSSLSNTVH